MPTPPAQAKSPSSRPSTHHPRALYQGRTGSGKVGANGLPDAVDGSLQPVPVEAALTEIDRFTSGDFTEYDAYLKLFVEAMKYKLRLNAHKGHIGDVPVADLLRFLKKEVQELEEAVGRNNHVEAMLEGADIANFAFGIMMKVMRGAANGV